MQYKIVHKIKLVVYTAKNNEEIICQALVPGFQIRGYQKHTISFNLPFQFYFIFSEENFHFFKRNLDIKNFDKTLLDSLGNFFGLQLYENKGKGIYAYKLKGLYTEPLYVQLAYYYSKEQNMQIFVLYTYFEGEERTYEKDTIYFHKIWQVEFDHEEFMKGYKG